MPNWCDNYIIISGSPEVLDAIKAEHIHGVEEEYNMTLNFSSLPNQNTHDRAVHEVVAFTHDGGSLHIDCLSAWSPPLFYLVQLSVLHPVSIYIKYGEPGDCFAGEATIEDGVMDNKRGDYVTTDDEGNPLEYDDETGEYLNADGEPCEPGGFTYFKPKYWHITYNVRSITLKRVDNFVPPPDIIAEFTNGNDLQHHDMTVTTYDGHSYLVDNTYNKVYMLTDWDTSLLNILNRTEPVNCPLTNLKPEELQ